jgi:assimilatory nitrate reductase catalytic subunit
MAGVQTTCAYCGVGCGIVAEATGPRRVSIKGDPAHPANHGRLCSKGTHLGETVGLEGRLLHPLLGERRATWDEALDFTAGRLRETIARHGPDAVAFYVSGQLLTEDYYVANKLMKGFIGSANIDTNSRLCMASAVAAHNRAFGEDLVPCSYADLDEADLILLVGSNTAWCHPVLWQRIEAARASRGTKIVVIDPRRTETAALADLHVPLGPDGDIALFNGLLAEMAGRGLATIPAVFRASLDPDPGIDPALFARLADLVAAAPRMVTAYSMGVNQSASGTDKANAIINLHLATGRINRPGAGPFSLTGQPNAMGGREVGGLANTLACHLGFSEVERADVAAFWQTDRLCTGPGLKALDMFRAIHAGQIRFLWIMATNPAVSLPDSGFIREALARCETVVVSDVIAETDTTAFAHVHLPALAWGEKDGTVTNSERQISRQRPVFAPPGEARADWWIINQVGRRLGWGAAFAHAGPAAIWREHAAMTGLARRHGKAFDLTGRATLTDAEYDALQPFQWGGRHPCAEREARLVEVGSPRPEADPSYPLALNTGRYRDQWHTMTRTGLSPTLSRHRREPCLEVHPADAVSHGLVDGGLARVTTPSGSAAFRVTVTEDQRRGDLFVPMHWTDRTAGEGRANRLPGGRADPVSGQPAFKCTPAQVAPLVPDWRAFLATVEQLAPFALARFAWWTAVRLPGGWLYQLAGGDKAELEALLPAGTRCEAADPTRGMSRIAVRGADGSLAAALCLTHSGTLPSPEWLASQLGTADAATAEWLAGRPRSPAPDRGPLVCLCNSVHTADIALARSAGAGTVAEIGDATSAGTNCGSCRPAIARLLEAGRATALEAVQ